jgi:hypothetical protein
MGENRFSQASTSLWQGSDSKDSRVPLESVGASCQTVPLRVIPSVSQTPTPRPRDFKLTQRMPPGFRGQPMRYSRESPQSGRVIAAFLAVFLFLAVVHEILGTPRGSVAAVGGTQPLTASSTIGENVYAFAQP